MNRETETRKLKELMGPGELELEILARHLTPEKESDEAEFKRQWLSKGPECLLMADLIRLAEGLPVSGDAAQARQHLETCDICQASVAAFKRADERAARRIASTARPAAPPKPINVPGLKAATDWDRTVLWVADLFNQGATLSRVLERTGLNAADCLRAVFEARDRFGINVPDPNAGTADVAPPDQSPESLERALQGLLRLLNPLLRRVMIFPSVESTDQPEGRAPDWEERLDEFGAKAAPHLVDLLSQAAYVGVGWGRMVTAAVYGIRGAYDEPPQRPKGPLGCVATVGGFVGMEKLHDVLSSSILARILSRALNDDDCNHVYPLHGVEAFVASYLGTEDEVEVVRKRTSHFPNYQAVFGGGGRAGKIDQLDAILTSCGDAHHYNSFWASELPKLGLTAERLNALTRGNIGGVLIEREDLGAEDKALIADINRRWQGITLRHIQNCVQRVPGVILMALGHNKADVVLKCVELGLVSELIIDQDLAMTLLHRVAPKRTPRPERGPFPA